jgi:hypothetical protein
MGSIKKKIKKFKNKIEEKRPDNPFLWRPLFFAKDFGRIFLFGIKKRKFRGVEIEDSFFIHNFKVAGSSIMSILRQYRGKDNNLNKREIKKKKFVVVFVRNPYDRVVSGYHHLIKGSKNCNTDVFLNGMYKEFWRFHGKFWPGISFKKFVKSVHSIPDRKANPHFISQYSFLTNKKGELIPDFIGKFENLEEDYKKAMKKIGIKNPPKLPQKNKSKRKKDWREYYDKETKKLVYERYKKDFELFGYDKEL